MKKNIVFLLLWCCIMQSAEHLNNDCLTIIFHHLPLPSLIGLEQVNRHFYSLIHDNCDLMVKSALITNENQYNMCTNALIHYAKDLYHDTQDHRTETFAKKEKIFTELWPLHKELRNQHLHQIMNHSVNYYTIADKVNLYAGRPGNKDVSQSKIYDYFCKCEYLLLTKNILKENNNFASVPSECWDFSIFFKYSLPLLIVKNFLTDPHGRGIDFRDAKGNTFLHMACKNNKLDIVQFLLENNATVNARNNYGSTPLEYAVKTNNINKETILLLLEKGANLYHTIPYALTNCTILYYMQQNKCVYSVFREILQTIETPNK